MARRGGIVPIIGGNGQWSPVWTRRFDFENAPDSEYFETFAQADPVIGMRAVDSLEYAPHALQQVWSNPDNMFRQSNAFDDASWTNLGSTLKKINENDWKFTTNDSTAIISQGLSVDHVDPLSLVVELPEGGSAPFARITLRDDGSDVVHMWVDLATGEISGTDIRDQGVVVSATRDPDNPRRYRICGNIRQRPTGTLTSAPESLSTNRAIGSQLLFKKMMLYHGDFWLPYSETGSVGALDNWTKSGDAAATFSLSRSGNRAVYRLDNSAGSADAFVEAAGGAGAAVPHTQSTVRSVNNGAFTKSTIIKTPASGGKMLETAAPGEIVEFYEPQWCEGQRVFDLMTEGAARYLIRRKQGIGGLWEPDGIQNKCQNHSIAPTDLTGVTDGGTTTTVVLRADLPANVKAALDAGPYKSATAMYRSQGSGTVYVTGPTGNTNEHFIRALLWAETGTAGAVLGLEGAGIAPISGVETLEWVEGKGTPASPTDRFTITVIDGDVYWIASMMNEGNKKRSHVPVAGANRVKSADRPVAPTDSVGIDRRRNGISDCGDYRNDPLAGVTVNITKGTIGGRVYADYEISGTATGSIALYAATGAEIPAGAQGETWFAAVSGAIVAGDLTNVTRAFLNLVERDAGQSGLANSTIDFLHLLDTTLRRYSVSRTFTEAATAYSSQFVQVDVAGAVNFTLRLFESSLQKSSVLLPHLETTTKAIPFQQWETDEGLTVVMETEDPALDVDSSRFWEMYGTNRSQNHIAVTSGSGAAQTDAHFNVRKGGSDTGTTAADIQGSRTSQAAMAEADQQFWIDGAGVGAPIAAAMPDDIDTVMLGDISTGGVNLDGVVKNITFIGERKTTA